MPTFLDDYRGGLHLPPLCYQIPGLLDSFKFGQRELSRLVSTHYDRVLYGVHSKSSSLHHPASIHQPGSPSPYHPQIPVSSWCNGPCWPVPGKHLIDCCIPDQRERGSGSNTFTSRLEQTNMGLVHTVNVCIMVIISRKKHISLFDIVRLHQSETHTP